MFENIGGKIKTLAVVFAVLGIIGSIVGGILLIDVTLDVLGITVILVGIVFSWICSCFIYGFGELIETAQKIERNTASSLAKIGNFANTNQNDKEVLYQFAVESIEKKCYKFGYDALKRIRGYKDSEELLKQIEDKI